MTNQHDAKVTPQINQKSGWNSFVKSIFCFIGLFFVGGMIALESVGNSTSEVTVIVGIGLAFAILSILALVAVFGFGIWFIRLLFRSKNNDQEKQDKNS